MSFLIEVDRANRDTIFSFRSHLRIYKTNHAPIRYYALERLSDIGHRFYKAYGPSDSPMNLKSIPFNIDGAIEFGDDVSWHDAYELFTRDIPANIS